MIQKTSNFSERIAIRIIKQVVSAVLYCHINGIVHRDIKSDNILFLNQDINSPVKLIDFGISVKFEKDTKLKEKTGTVLYIAPEVISGSYDEKCDIWSCGVLMYMMLCGVPPFNGKSRKEVMDKVRRGQFSFSSKIWSVISSEAKNLISQMLTLDPATRPSCREVLSHAWFNKDNFATISSTLILDSMRKHEVAYFKRR
jgi:calcium-dependent protein kinase